MNGTIEKSKDLTITNEIRDILSNEDNFRKDAFAGLNDFNEGRDFLFDVFNEKSEKIGFVLVQKNDSESIEDINGNFEILCNYDIILGKFKNSEAGFMSFVYSRLNQIFSDLQLAEKSDISIGVSVKNKKCYEILLKSHGFGFSNKFFQKENLKKWIDQTRRAIELNPEYGDVINLNYEWDSSANKSGN